MSFLLVGFWSSSNPMQGRCDCWLAESVHRSSPYRHVSTTTREQPSVKFNLVPSFLSIFVLLVGVFIPLWIIPDSFSKLSAGAFCVQFGVQG